MAFSFGDFMGSVGDFFTGGDGFGVDDVFRNLSGAAGAYNAIQGTDAQKPYFYPGQEQGLAMGADAAQQQFQQGPNQYYGEPTVAALDPNVAAGQNAQLGMTGNLNNLARGSGEAAGTLQQGGSDRVGGFQLQDQIGFGLDPQYQKAIMDPINNNLTQNILPALDSQATAQGAFGGSRAAQQKADAATQANEAATNAMIQGNLQARGQSIGQRAGDISAQLSGRSQDITQNQIENAARASGISGAGTAMNQALLPGQIQKDVGTERMAYEQDLINADKARFDWNRGENNAYVDRLMSRMQGLPAPIPGAGGTDGNWLDALQGFGLGTNIYSGITTPPIQGQ